MGKIAQLATKSYAVSHMLRGRDLDDFDLISMKSSISEASSNPKCISKDSEASVASSIPMYLL